jgi:uncharacterized protein (DUF2235 family)
MTTPTTPSVPTKRNLVMCLDGTNNEPEHGVTNVARIFDIAQKNEPHKQLVYYDPGVGTMGARGAVTQLGQALTRVAGLAAGFGIKDDIEQAYTWLSRNYQENDEIYVFGFSRGAYTARALTGMLHTVGLLRPGTENLVPYALKLYARGGPPASPPGVEPDAKTKEAQQKFWEVRDEFARQFGNPKFPSMFDTSRRQIHFLGVWDTVKSVGWLNLKGQIQIARWPFTAKINNVEAARHALSIDERRRPFAEYRFNPDTVAESNGRYQEMWFAGVHSDVGGQFPDDHRLSDIALSWMVKEAEAKGLLVRKQRYFDLLNFHWDDEVPADNALGRIHKNEKVWWLAGGWRNRKVLPTDAIHPRVQYRIENIDGYRPDLKRPAVRV